MNMSYQFDFHTNDGEKQSVGKRIGNGSFGDVQIIKHTKTNTLYALKHEIMKETPSSNDFEKSLYQRSQLMNEQDIQKKLSIIKTDKPNNLLSRSLASLKTFTIFNKSEDYIKCNIKSCQQNHSYFATQGQSDTSCQLITNLQVKNIGQLWNECGRKFSTVTICYLALMILMSIEELHSIDYVHKDLKPENMMIPFNYSEDPRIYLIDFGLSSRYRKNGKHIKKKNRQFMTGTCRQSSVNAMKGFEHGRADDMESFAQNILFLQRGSLPWQGIDQQTKRERIDKTLVIKENTDFNQITQGAPSFILKLIYYAKQLQFDDDINYHQIRKWIQDDLKLYGIENPVYDQDWLNLSRDYIFKVTSDENLVTNTRYDQLKKQLQGNKIKFECCGCRKERQFGMGKLLDTDRNQRKCLIN